MNIEFNGRGVFGRLSLSRAVSPAIFKLWKTHEIQQTYKT